MAVDPVSPHYLSKGFHNTLQLKKDRRYPTHVKIPNMLSQASGRNSACSIDSNEVTMPKVPTLKVLKVKGE
jgi:hypothetical protein